jgi:hypothetical protein
MRVVVSHIDGENDRGSSSLVFGPSAGTHLLPGLGRCTAKMGDDGDDTKLLCMESGPQSSCAVRPFWSDMNR